MIQTAEAALSNTIGIAYWLNASGFTAWSNTPLLRRGDVDIMKLK
jgi:hypothetical protein